jgi:hypothetical protein
MPVAVVIEGDESHEFVSLASGVRLATGGRLCFRGRRRYVLFVNFPETIV